MGEAFQIRGDPLTHIPAQVAASWARAGFPVFPCRPKEEVVNGVKKKAKTPLTEHGFKDATTDLAKVASYWRDYPDALVGIATGEASGLFVVDLDVEKDTGEAIGEASFAALGLSHLLGVVPTVATPSGGRHLYFRDCGLGSLTAKPNNAPLGPKVDTRGNGGYVIAPGSVTPQGIYSLLTGRLTLADLTSVPEAILERLQGNSDRSAARQSPRIDIGQTDYSDNVASEAEVSEILAHINPDCGYGEWLDVLMGLHDRFNGGAAGFALADEWSARGTKYQRGEVAAKWKGFTAGGGTGWATVCHIARQYGADLGAIARKHRGQQDVTLNAGFNCRRPPALTHTAPPQAATEGADGQFVLGRKGRPIWCAENACMVLETDPAWQETLAYDEFAGLTLLLRPIPGTTVPRANFAARPLADTDITAAVRWFNRNGFPDATKNTTADALYAVAAQTIISPVRHYLEGLSWDGVPRAGEWLIRYCGAEDTNFVRKVGQAWLVSAVARALQPGCKADCALVLEGKQGLRKSSGLKALAGEAWFHDGLHDLHSKDASAGLRGKWIIELPELSAIRRSDTEAVKAFLSRTEERYRPAYGRAEVIEPRRCVFAGTTNRSDYLTDDTGGRRFWPVVVGEVLLADLARDRDQIWAEAVALFRAGEKWWLDRETETEAAAVVAVRAADDPWSADVLSLAEGLSEVSTRDIFQLMEIPRERQNKADAMRIVGILTRAGWTRSGKFTAGPNRDLSRYLRPEGRP